MPKPSIQAQKSKKTAGKNDATKKTDAPAPKDEKKAAQTTAQGSSGARAGNQAHTHQVTAKGCERRCRAGHCFTQEPTLIAQADFTEEQFEALTADAYLTVEALTTDA